VLLSARTACALAILLTAGGARAQDADPSHDATPLVLDPGVVIARATIESGAWAPASLAPDVWIGATERLTLGATSSEAARGWVGAGRGLCLHACTARYGGAAADARFRVHDGALAIAGRAALDFRAFGPGVVALELGVAVRSRAGAVIVTVSPYVSLGIVNAALDNHVQAVVPLELRWPLGRVALALRGGVRGDVDGFLATAEAPVGASIDVEVARGIAIGAGAGLPRIGHPDQRAVDLHVEWRP
jgi:hypothetical protein